MESIIDIIYNNINDLEFTVSNDDGDGYITFESDSVSIYGNGSYNIVIDNNKIRSISFYPNEYPSFTLHSKELRIGSQPLYTYNDAVAFCNKHYKEKVIENHFNKGIK